MLGSIRAASLRRLLAAMLIASLCSWVDTSAPAQRADPLPSWNDGAAKRAILDFVGRIAQEGDPDFVPADQRIATFDNDGTLWAEQPIYIQFAFAIDRVRALSNQYPEWKEMQPFKAAIEGDLGALAAAGQKGLLQIIAATHVGMTTASFRKSSRTGSPPHAIRVSTGSIPRWFITQCWS